MKEENTLGEGSKFMLPSLSLGKHKIQLVITDTRGVKEFDEVIVYVIDGNLPVAHAGKDQSAELGDIIELNASKSYDLDGTIISYEWTRG